ncbi:uncharacterized protein LOC129599955 [Paramacrobiotus metropolitanus]|uniref:uncharacterized protein LOC129599955 n=1 Tax=Paramacrobiotus metropolitanus TaxID=2943436 RepID=UPI002445C19E|nr:uncharacterized protein LOC129599955 [Paramacrobiotus metropolitanus]
MSNSCYSATNGQKRKRARSETPSERGSSMAFVDRVSAMEDQFVSMLKNCQKQIAESGKSQGVLVTCCAMYTFQKDIKDIQSLVMNDYGSGKLEQVRMVVTGEEIMPAWMESGVALQAYFERKVGTNRRHSSGDARKRGFEVPWRASVQLQSIPPGCFVESVQLSFINPASDGSPTVKMDLSAEGASNLYLINDKLMNIRGQTYSECCRELGIFRQGFCYITLRVPLRLLIRDQLKQLRADLPHNAVAEDEHDYSAVSGNDNVTLKFGRSSMKVGRQVLLNISTETHAIFGAKTAGQVSVYEMSVSKEVATALLGAVNSAADYLPLNPERTTLSFLYELVALSSDWDIPSVKLWTQLVMLERLCAPGVNLQQIPVDKLIKLIRHEFDWNGGVKMVLLGFTFALRDMCLVDILPATMNGRVVAELDRISEDPTLKDVFQPAEMQPSVATSADAVKGECKTLTVRFQDGNSMRVRVSESANIQRIKAAVGNFLGIPIYQQRMIFKDRRLDDLIRVSECGFEDGDEIEMYTEQYGC